MKKTLLTVALVAFACSVSFASSITFNVSGKDTAGDTVNAQALVVTANGVVTVTLSNLLGTSPLASITDAGQLLSDFDFTLSNSPGTVSTTNAGTGNLILVAKTTGAVTADGSNQSLGWGVSASGDTITLNGLGGLNTPNDLLLGLACLDGDYCNGNGSIDGNTGHNPFALNGAVFTIDASGITSTTTITAATFSFGTQGNDDLPGTSGTVPEPASLALLGSGLLGLGWAFRRRFLGVDVG